MTATVERLILTPEQIAAFDRDGFLALPPVVDAAEIARLRVLLERLYRTHTGFDHGEQFDLAGSDADPDRPGLPQILGPSRFEPELERSPFKAICWDLAHQLLGGPREELALSCEHAILKPARHGAVTPWHQDEAYWRMPNHDARAIAIWMPLQDVTPENGCLWYMPGSHRGVLRAHRPIGGDPRVHGLETLDVDASQGVAVPLSAGGLVLHHVRTMHYAGPNHGPSPRFAYTYALFRPSLERSVPHVMPHLAVHQPASQERAQKRSSSAGPS